MAIHHQTSQTSYKHKRSIQGQRKRRNVMVFGGIACRQQVMLSRFVPFTRQSALSAAMTRVRQTSRQTRLWQSTASLSRDPEENRHTQRMVWTPESQVAGCWTSRVVDEEPSSSSSSPENSSLKPKKTDDDTSSSMYYVTDDPNEGRLPARQLGVLHPNPATDMELLTRNYTLPALASALRDREDALQQAAILAADNDIDQLKDVLRMFHPNLVMERRKKRHTQDVTRCLKWSGLEQIRKTLARLPRTVVTAHDRRAAVVIPLCTIHGVPCLLLEQRSFTMNHFPGQVCLPGGMVCEVADRSIVSTCLREMREEIAGLPESQTQVLGVFRTNWGQVHHLGGVAVTPVVCFLGELSDQNLQPNADEVAQVFTIPLTDLTRDHYCEDIIVTQDGSSEPNVSEDSEGSNGDEPYWLKPKGRAPVFRGGPYPIWGLTGYILDKFTKDILIPNSRPPSSASVHN